MFEVAISRLGKILETHPWAGELAGILPLSALIDFMDLPRKLHVFELAGAVPFWSWPVTPAGSRLLLSSKHTQRDCCLDRYGSSVALTALDGCYGDQYIVSSPETVRMCISSRETHTLPNDHDNMAGENLKIQNLEIICISRERKPERRFQPSQSWLGRILLDPWLAFSYQYLLISTLGWIMLLGMIIMSGIFRCYLSLTFLIVIPVTGVVIFCLHGSTPRRLLVQEQSDYNRLVVVAEHMNATDWMVFYGESTIVNSLLNRPLEPMGPRLSKSASAILRGALRVLVLGQWGLAIGVAALKDWNAFFITFWIAFCIFSHAYLIAPPMSANDWMRSYANIKMARYQTQLSSRRSLFNTIIALNPDTFSWDNRMDQEDRTKFSEGAMRWIDPILTRGSSRTKWEDATRTAMDEALLRYSTESLVSPAWQDKDGEVLGFDWNDNYSREYWKSFILEGIYMAAKIKEETRLFGRKVTKIV
ncbi:peptidase family m3 [Diplodia corticola]|uniref:Peptidase family m3 n=1 Tax=Diplodia corticola TaxID=236234 RepID=A0A1J9R8N0_9PEZI|nr:peptidase family m3 [Diplodia corticola]OJD36530.1 peptidase family m3 [Diplodia corticola]